MLQGVISQYYPFKYFSSSRLSVFVVTVEKSFFSF